MVLLFINNSVCSNLWHSSRTNALGWSSPDMVTTVCRSTPPQRLLSTKILVPILDTLILVLGVGGHTVVMVILCGRLSAGTGTDILLVALSVADLLLLSMLPFHTVAIAMQRWPFGDFMCRLVGFLGSACSSASVFTLAVLAVSRYLTIVHPAKAYSLLSSPRVSAAAALLWVPACCLAVPQLVFRSVGTPKLAADGLACFSFQSHRDQVIYGLVHFVMAFLLPLITIAVAYSSIYVFLWRSQNNGRAPQVERYQRKVTQTSAMLVLAFTLCWLPSYGLMLALLEDNRSGATGTSPRYGAFTVFARVMATSSTVVNPILYVLMSEKFRQDLLRLFKRAGIQQERTNSCRQIKPQHISPVYISKVLHLRLSSTRNNFKLWLQRNTAFLDVGCILLCTCRLGLLERWEDTAGSSLHCYYCRDWCLGTQKQRNKWTKQTKDVPQ
uniref:G-protein coupled receptors family 1 profile domain-containing protein n=1 Tax=Cynoglossus semilaevis TaxID=244447 RepID=A0A3P8V001_CYNSE